jgi:hypothetical protein
MPPHVFKQPMMSPKIDPRLQLQASGTQVAVTGPAGTWDTDNVLVGFSAVVSQVIGDGSGAASVVTSMGWSKYTEAAQPPGNPPKWGLTAKVLDGARGFDPGGAVCSAWALYAERDGGSWVYEWRLPVELV